MAEPPCNSTLPLANAEPLVCTLPAGHAGNHADGAGSSWIPDGPDPFEPAPEPLVSSVVVHTEGAHEAVNVWLRGAHVGKLLVGQGQGKPLRNLLLVERAAPGPLTHGADRPFQPYSDDDDLDQLRSRVVSKHNAMMMAARRADAASATLDRVRSWAADWYHCMSPAAREQLDSALGESTARLHMRAEQHLAEVIAEQTLPPGVEVRMATDAEQREALDRVRSDYAGFVADCYSKKLDPDDPRREALDKVLAGVERTKRMGEGD